MDTAEVFTDAIYTLPGDDILILNPDGTSETATVEGILPALRSTDAPLVHTTSGDINIATKVIVVRTI